ncbi:ABC transporter substrate-binding protein [Nitratireductor basaltis]|uniref:Putative Bacterial extracellular solute-binding protein n=1 Tax=Nitratireductor basaltis TaxID=472175 RepID=A0A084UE98_9HYPH|nr:ABC transporter substrate-binding protein [Nitratireductor basaltis]KFB11284.1 putative Bacterial extracellular solute-binding protein [Nitratireductor basaltis]
MNSLAKILIAGASLLATASAAFAIEGKLTLYTSQPNDDAQQTVDAFMAKYPDVEVTFVRDGTTKIVAKLRAELEAGNSPADLLLIADSVTMEGLAKDGYLKAYEEADVSDYADEMQDPERMWFPTKLITTGIIYNTNAPMKPTSWKDLLGEEARNQVAMPSPLTSGAALIHTHSIVETLDTGWDYYEQLAANGAQASGGNGGVLKAVAGGEKLYGMVVEFLPIREKAKGAPVDFVFPEEGVSAISEPVAILDGTQNEEAAQAFVDFLLSEEGQELAAKQGYMPALADVAPPEGFPSLAEISFLTIDPAKALESAEADKEKFAEIFGQN